MDMIYRNSHLQMFDFTNNVIFDKNCNSNTTTAIYNSPMISNMNMLTFKQWT